MVLYLLDPFQWNNELKNINESSEDDMLIPAEISRHKLLLIDKLLHEGQHEATMQFFNLRNVASRAMKATESGPAQNTRSQMGALHDGGKGAGQKMGTPSPPSSQTEAAKSLKNTPPEVGNTGYRGNERGDSGHALEEIIFGGRIKHRRLDGKSSFHVRTDSRQPLLRVSEKPCMQMHQVIIKIGETADKEGNEMWYTDAYVEKQLDRLEKRESWSNIPSLI